MMDSKKPQSESREQRAERLTDVANDSFRNHAIASRENGRWLLRNPSTSIFWTEIIVGHGGYLIVNGDIDHVIWGRFNDRYDDPERVLRWIGSHSVVDSYTAGKAVIGTGAQLAQEVDPRVYAYDLLFAIEDEKDGAAKEDIDNDYISMLNEAITHVTRGDDLRDVSNFLWDADVDPELISSLGCVPAVRVYYAHAAVVRLHALLTAEEESREMVHRQSLNGNRYGDDNE